MALTYEYYFRVVKTIFYERAQLVKYCFQHDKIIFISSSYRVMFFLLCGQKSEQANREHINPAGKHTRFSRVIYFFISSLMKIWTIREF